MIRALLVDDEAPARSELRYLLSAHPEVEVVGEAASVEEALARGVGYDVVFLDVELAEGTGLEAAPLIRGRRQPPAIVFVTAHERYAVDAFAALDGLEVAVRVAVVSSEGPSDLAERADLVVGSTDAFLDLLKRL